MYFVRHQQLMPGKEVRIELTTHTGKYAGVVNEIYCGVSQNFGNTFLKNMELQ